MRQGGLIIALALTCAGCSAHPEPIIDTKGVNQTVYEQDLAECSEFAEAIEYGDGMARGAAAGAVTGAAIGAIRGNVGEAAGVGAVLGSSRSGVKAATDREQVVKRCLRYRGYRVLN